MTRRGLLAWIPEGYPAMEEFRVVYSNPALSPKDIAGIVAASEFEWRMQGKAHAMENSR